MFDPLSLFVPDDVDPLDEQAARRAAIECLNAIDQLLRTAELTRGGTVATEDAIFRCFFDLEKALGTAQLYWAFSSTLGPMIANGLCVKVGKAATTIRAEIFRAVEAFKTVENAPSDGWSNLWHLFRERFGYSPGPTWADAVSFVDKTDADAQGLIGSARIEIPQAVLERQWHFAAWPTVCDRLKQFPRRQLDDLMGALLNLSEHVTDDPISQQVKPPIGPPMWEGGPPDFPIETLADVLSWLDQKAANLPLMRDYAGAFKQDAALDSAHQVFRNARRLLDHLGAIGFPDRHDSELRTIHDVEEAIADLRRWLGQELAKHDLVTTKEIMYLVGVKQGRFNNVLSKARISGDSDLPKPLVNSSGSAPPKYSYHQIRPFLLRKWPDREPFLPKLFEEVQAILANRPSA